MRKWHHIWTIWQIYVNKHTHTQHVYVCVICKYHCLTHVCTYIKTLYSYTYVCLSVDRDEYDNNNVLSYVIMLQHKKLKWLWPDDHMHIHIYIHTCMYALLTRYSLAVNLVSFFHLLSLTCFTYVLHVCMYCLVVYISQCSTAPLFSGYIYGMWFLW